MSGFGIETTSTRCRLSIIYQVVRREGGGGIRSFASGRFVFFQEFLSGRKPWMAHNAIQTLDVSFGPPKPLLYEYSQRVFSMSILNETPMRIASLASQTSVHRAHIPYFTLYLVS